jgi:hypothetical protein
VVKLPEAETEHRLKATTYQWPIMHMVTYGVNRDQFMARHKANHVHVVYVTNVADATRSQLARAPRPQVLGIEVFNCGAR